MSTKTDFNYLSKVPGVQLIKEGTYNQKELDEVVGIPNLKSQINDIPISSEEKPIQLGYFSMQPSVDFEFTYEYLELKIVIRGNITVHDDQGKTYVAETGDVLVFTPETTVTFDSKSNGDAVVAAHRSPDPSFM